MKTNKHIAALLAQIEKAKRDIWNRQLWLGDRFGSEYEGSDFESFTDLCRDIVRVFDRLDKIGEGLKSMNAVFEELDEDVGARLGSYQGDYLDENTGELVPTAFFDNPIPDGWIRNPKTKKVENPLSDGFHEVTDGPEYVRSTEASANKDGQNSTNATITPPPPTTDKSTHAASEAIIIPLTEGMINQNMLTFTVNRKRIFKGDEILTIHFGREKITSKIVKPGYRLRERGAVKRFYKANDARPGDQVVLTKDESGEFVASVKKQTPKEIPTEY